MSPYLSMGSGGDHIPVAETGLLVHYLGQDAKIITETRFLAWGAIACMGRSPVLTVRGAIAWGRDTAQAY
ncbi:MAG: hypothetical protein AB4352_11580 [Hormoscilla sp.]